MNERRAFLRKLIYLAIVVALLFPLLYLSQPGTVDEKGELHGGLLTRMRSEYGLSQANLGEIDPWSESFKLATLGLRPVAALMLWEKSHYYKKVEDWANFEVVLNQLIRLQPNFISVWEFQAHNLSFNISAEFDDWRNKYYYVVKGLKFLISGTRYNQNNSLLLGRIGWFVTQKIGKSDERVPFRRKFARDTELHEYLNQFIDMSRTRRDSWLVGKEWYLQAQEAVEKHGSKVRGESEVIFHSHPGLTQIYYADTLEDEGHFGELARQAWQEGARDWHALGVKEFYGYTGVRYHLEDLEDFQARAKAKSAELDALVGPEVRQRLQDAKRGALTAAQRTALDTPAEKRTTEQQNLANEAEFQLRVTDKEVAAAAPADRISAARHIAAESTAASDHVQLIEGYRSHVNYEYWRLKCEAEMTDDAIEARRLGHTALDQQAASSLTDSTKALFERSFAVWKKVIDEFPTLFEDSTVGDDLFDTIQKYKQLLADRGETLPKDFVLRELNEKYEKRR